MGSPGLTARIASVRRFNRFYTGQIGVLQEHILRSPFSLAEARVLYELAHRRDPTATELGRDLALDAGYLSRILRRFERGGLVERRAARSDARRSLLRLTARGKRAFAGLDSSSRAEIGGLLGRLRPADQSRLIQAMDRITALLGGRPKRGMVTLRAPRPGDLGWVIERHGAVYAREYGWDQSFEALVAGIVADFLKKRDHERERCWIAEHGGARVGCVFLVTRSTWVGQLRLLLVEPEARGLGVGGTLVKECVDFARRAGYRKLMLWTNDVLHAARRIYQRAGFTLTSEERHRSFGQELVGQVWELRL
jgi:DNA-binding MarR family transcriptional regulator/N-acetylglutamate synthase-like GNAT family acetyltransferase